MMLTKSQSYTNFQDIPPLINKTEIVDIDPDQGETGGSMYRLNDIIGVGVVNLRRCIHQYTKGNVIAGIILGRENGHVLVAHDIAGLLADGSYCAQDKDVDKIPQDRFKSMIVCPTTLEELIPYDPGSDDQKDLDQKQIDPSLRHLRHQ